MALTERNGIWHWRKVVQGYLFQHVPRNESSRKEMLVPEAAQGRVLELAGGLSPNARWPAFECLDFVHNMVRVDAVSLREQHHLQHEQPRESARCGRFKAGMPCERGQFRFGQDSRSVFRTDPKVKGCHEL